MASSECDSDADCVITPSSVLGDYLQQQDSLSCEYLQPDFSALQAKQLAEQPGAKYQILQGIVGDFARLVFAEARSFTFAPLKSAAEGFIEACLTWRSIEDEDKQLLRAYLIRIRDSGHYASHRHPLQSSTVQLAVMALVLCAVAAFAWRDSGYRSCWLTILYILVALFLALWFSVLLFVQHIARSFSLVSLQWFVHQKDLARLATRCGSYLQARQAIINGYTISFSQTQSATLFAGLRCRQTQAIGKRCLRGSLKKCLLQLFFTFRNASVSLVQKFALATGSDELNCAFLLCSVETDAFVFATDLELVSVDDLLKLLNSQRSEFCRLVGLCLTRASVSRSLCSSSVLDTWRFSTSALRSASWLTENITRELNGTYLTQSTAIAHSRNPHELSLRTRSENLLLRQEIDSLRIHLQMAFECLAEFDAEIENQSKELGETTAALAVRGSGLGSFDNHLDLIEKHVRSSLQCVEESKKWFACHLKLCGSCSVPVGSSTGIQGAELESSVTEQDVAVSYEQQPIEDQVFEAFTSAACNANAEEEKSYTKNGESADSVSSVSLLLYELKSVLKCRAEAMQSRERVAIARARGVPMAEVDDDNLLLPDTAAERYDSDSHGEANVCKRFRPSLVALTGERVSVSVAPCSDNLSPNRNSFDSLKQELAFQSAAICRTRNLAHEEALVDSDSEV